MCKTCKVLIDYTSMQSGIAIPPWKATYNAWPTSVKTNTTKYMTKSIELLCFSDITLIDTSLLSFSISSISKVNIFVFAEPKETLVQVPRSSNRWILGSLQCYSIPSCTRLTKIHRILLHIWWLQFALHLSSIQNWRIWIMHVWNRRW